MERSELAPFNLDRLSAALLLRVLNWDSLPSGLAGDLGIERSGDPVSYRMAWADCLLEGHGVEAIYASDDDGYQDSDTPFGYYVNMGDTYTTTVVWDATDETFLITDWGTFYEERQAEHERERDQEYISELEGAADSDLFGTEESWSAWFNGRQSERGLPAEMVADCSRPGPVDDAVKSWVKRIGLDAPPWLLRQYLRRDVGGYQSYGNHRENIERLALIWASDARDDLSRRLSFYLGV